MEMRCIIFVPLRVGRVVTRPICNERTELKWFSISEMLLLTNMVDSDYPPFALLAMPGEAS
jgi:hypothetical protein